MRRGHSLRVAAAGTLAVALVFGASGAAHAFELELKLGLLNRFTMRRNAVERFLRYSPQARAYDTNAFINPQRDDTYYSFVANAGVFLGVTRWLGFGFSVDSGELRPHGRLPATATVAMPDSIAQRFGEPVVMSTDDQRVTTSNGQTIGAEAKQTVFVRQAFMRLMVPGSEWLSLEVGRRDLDVANGLIYDDYGLGVSLVVDLQRKWREGGPRVSARAILPTRGYTSGTNSPLLEGRVSWAFSKLESIGLLFSYFHDGDSNFGRMLDPLVSEVAVATAGDASNTTRHSQLFALTSTLAPQTSADVTWLGLVGNKIIGGKLMLSATALVQLGQLRLTNPLPELTQALSRAGVDLGALVGSSERELLMPTVGFAVDAGARFLLSETMVLGGWFLYLSGAANPLLDNGSSLDSTYRGFLSIVPYITRTNIFFSGGLNQTFTGRRTSSAGVNARGVLAGGLTWEWGGVKNLELRATAAALFSDVASMSGGRFYGVELDSEASYSLTKWLGASVEYDVLLPGSFFREQRTIHQLLVGLDIRFDFHKG